ncbi:MAG: thiamine phosphate synthase [Desulfobulbaceae bacterium]|nr:thiamine phosphate synthase [Desulfobulbaceae bacterium]
MRVGRSEAYIRRLRQLRDEVTVYPVSCERLAEGRSDEQWLDDVLRGGARIVQLRDKESTDRQLLRKAKYFREKTREAGALFLVNDRVDIAMLADADGIHLGQKDLPPEEVVKLVPDMLIGISCNSEEQARQLGVMEREGNLPVSYYNIGPIYPTKTKDGLVEFIGPDAIGLFSSYLTIPFTVMGGIKLDHVPELRARGVRRIALVTALTQAPHIAAETERWIQAMNETYKGVE